MTKQLIDSADNLLDSLAEGATGLRFDVTVEQDNNAEQASVIPAFAVRFDGQVFAYLNRCGHIAVQLDYMPGEFFSDDGQSLICATHGAEYAPDTGQCLGGPCYGVGLEPLEVKESAGRLYLTDNRYKLITPSCD